MSKHILSIPHDPKIAAHLDALQLGHEHLHGVALDVQFLRADLLGRKKSRIQRHDEYIVEFVLHLRQDFANVMYVANHAEKVSSIH